MDVETSLLHKLELLGFNFRKGIKFQELGTREFLNVYKIFFKIYDSAWSLNDEKPTATVLKLIQGYLQRMDLGHLVTKGEESELLDPKKNCRLLGALIGKIESRLNGTTNVSAAVRKVKLLSSKTSSEKNNQKKQHQSDSDSGSGGEVFELVVPQKGKELPRTPPRRPASYTDFDDNSADFLKEKPAPFPAAPPPITYSKPTRIVETKKGFRPILPTREIPRTPMKGVTTPVEEGYFLQVHNPNLTVDFSASRLTSSNTSTPYSDSRTSNRSDPVGAQTFVVSPLRSEDLMENKNTKQSSAGESDSLIEDSVFENEQSVTKSSVKTTKQQEEKEILENFNKSWQLELDDKSAIEDENMAPTNAQLAKKKPGKEPKNSKVLKEKSAKPDVAAKTNDDATVKIAVETPENDNVETADTVVVAPKGKRGKGKKGGKMQPSQVHVEEAVDPETVESEPPVPVAAPEVKKTRGVAKKTGKKDTKEKAEDAVPVNAEPQVELDSPVPDAEVGVKKGRGRKGGKESPAQTDSGTSSPIFENEDKKGNAKKGGQKKFKQVEKSPVQLESATSSPISEIERGNESPSNTESGTSSPIFETGMKKVLGKKAGKKISQEVDEAIAEHSIRVELESPVPADAVDVKKGKGNKDMEEAESPAQTESGTSSPIFEPEMKKGRGKKGAKKAIEEAESPAQTESGTSSPIFESEEKKGKTKKGGKKETEQVDESPSKVDSATSSPVFESKTGRGKKVIPEEASDDPKENEDPPPVVVEAKAKRARGRKAQPAAKEEEIPDAPEDTPDPVEAITEQEKEVVAESKVPAKGRGRGKKVNNPVKEVPVVPEEKETVAAEVAEPKKRGRGKKTEIDTAELVVKADAQHEAINEPPAEVKKVRGKATASAAPTIETNEVSQPEAPVAEIKKGGRRGPKAVAEDAKEEDDEAPAAEPEPEKKGRGKQAAAKSSGEAETEPPKAPVVEVKKGRGRPAKAVSVEDVSEASQVPSAPEVAPVKKGRGKKAAVVAKPADEPEDVADSAEEDAEPPKKQKAAKRGKAAEDDVTSPPKKLKEDAVEPEGLRKSSRNQGQPVKSYDETEKKEPKARATKKVEQNTGADEDAKVEDKKKPGKKKTADIAEPDIQPKVVAKRGGNKRGISEDQKEAEPSVPEEKKGRGGKKAALPVADEPEEESEGSPPKKNKQDESDKAPEKKPRGRKKKEDVAAETEKDSTNQATKKVEVEKKKPVGRKKAADKEPETEASPAKPKQRAKRTVQPPKEAEADSNDSSDASPAGPTAPKGRKLKQVEPAAASSEEDEGDVPAVVAPKRTYRRK